MHKKTEEQTHKPVRDDISTQYFAELRFDLFGESLQTESIDWLRVSSQQWAGWTTHAHLYGVYKQHYNMQKSLDVNRSLNVDSIKPLTDVGDAEPKCMVVFSWALITMGGYLVDL